MFEISQSCGFFFNTKIQIKKDRLCYPELLEFETTAFNYLEIVPRDFRSTSLQSTCKILKHSLIIIITASYSYVSKSLDFFPEC